MVQVFFAKLIKDLCLVALLLTAGFVSYKVTIAYYVTTEEYNASEETTNTTKIMEATCDAIASNLVYCVDESTGEIYHIVLEIVNTNTNNADFITIPAKTQVTVSTELMKELESVNSAIPQIITISDIYKYFNQSTVYEYGAVILEDALGIDISFYTAIPQHTYKEIFESVEKTDSVITEQLKDSYKSTISQLNDTTEILDYLTTYYEGIQTNLSLKDRMTYISTYNKVDVDYVYYHEIDIDKAATQIETIKNNSSYIYTQQEQEQKASQEGLTVQESIHVQILNSSNIQGLALKYQTLLENGGLIVDSIGNYDGETLLTTKVIVSKEEYAQLVEEYFQNPTITVDETLQDYGVVIILGTQDSE